MLSSMLNLEFLLGFLESYPAAVTVFEVDGKIIFVNKRGCDIIKKSDAELVGQHVQDFVADRAAAERIISRVKAKGYLEGRMHVNQIDGGSMEVLVSLILVRDGAGQPMGIVGMVRGENAALDKTSDIAVVIQRIIDQFPEANMLTVEEVASELRVSKETVRRWVRSEQLPCVKLPRGIRIPSEVLRNIIRLNLEKD